MPAYSYFERYEDRLITAALAEFLRNGKQAASRHCDGVSDPSRFARHPAEVDPAASRQQRVATTPAPILEPAHQEIEQEND